ncbi:hypothetical protein [Candidatus Poriferisodalis sp.]|uniref:hypothetical protein n=1 Tax=Candidatus Poriferisodalis sp. TaxID=3101277 RepID=UPI003B0208BC
MLRESADAQGQPINVPAVTRPLLGAQLPLGDELLAFADAITLGDFDELPIARADLIAAGGGGATVRAAAVCANFEATNRVVDAVGVPVNKRFYDIGAELGVEVPDHLR